MQINFAYHFAYQLPKGFGGFWRVLVCVTFFSIKFKIIVYSGFLGAGVVQLVRTLPCHNAVHC